MKQCACKPRPLCVDSRGYHTYRRRRYKCPACLKTWTTIEVFVAELKPGRGHHRVTDALASSLDRSRLNQLKDAISQLLNQF